MFETQSYTQSDLRESTDSNKNIHRFLSLLYGDDLGDNSLVLWTKQDRLSYSFNNVKVVPEVVQDLKIDYDVYFEIGLQNEVPPKERRGKKNSEPRGFF